MDGFSIKNAIFFPDKIVLIRKNNKTVIETSLIDYIKYKKPTLLNYILASVWFGDTFPGRLEIHLKDNLITRNIYYTKLYLIKIKYKDYKNLPEIYRQKLLN